MASSRRHRRTRQLGEPLTRDECLILQLYSEGKRASHIAARFICSETTIKEWSTNIYQKFGIESLPTTTHKVALAVGIALRGKLIKGPRRVRHPPKLSDHLCAIIKLVLKGETNEQIAKAIYGQKAGKKELWWIARDLMQANEICKTTTRAELGAFALVNKMIE